MPPHKGHHGGASMRAFRPRRARKPQSTDTMCPVCYSVAREPCRAVISPPGALVLKRGGVLTKTHPQRRPAT